ncbi:cellulose synthase (UDP-forming) [Georgenia soli]|uniref:Cellulose synthase (UDP-forming) n=1 Tax=Georgenia soli TaxID=638953 RepID=A0A2A9EI79_9MICO|nr:cellulose synthase catalytic subunit [Georgenia soli]PFG37965.1 cellulose synthase (UDP-forming) [Georgenia soli]
MPANSPHLADLRRSPAWRPVEPAAAAPARVDETAAPLPRRVLRERHRAEQLATLEVGSPVRRDWEERLRGVGQGQRNLESPSLTMLVLLATIGVLLYASFLMRPENSGDLLPWLIVIVCESIMMGQVLISLWTQLSSTHNPRDFTFNEASRNLFVPVDWDLNAPLATDQMQLDGVPVTVDVFITTYGEPVETIRATAAAARAMRGRHETWILDDGRSPEVEALAAELGVSYLTRPDNKGAKAGNINHALGRTSGDYFVILDADFVPSPDLLVETIPFFAQEKVAFVQTPQVYGNIHNFITRGAGYLQTVFYSLIQPGKNRFNSAFCVGTNVVFARAAIAEIGGMYTRSKSEDVWTSMKLHELGWRSVYIPDVLAVGDTPETIEAYTKQQTRWATGAFEILFRANPLRNRRLSVDQRLQYFGTATFYLGGLVTFALLLLPPLQIFLDLTPIATDLPLWEWALYYSGFYVMQIVVATYTIGSFRWETLLLSTVSFPMYIRAMAGALLGRDRAWHVTGRAGRAASPFNYIVPQMLMFLALVVTSVVGLWKAEWSSTITLALVWNTVNALALAAFLGIAVREALALRRTERPVPPTHAATPSPATRQELL